MTEEEQHYQKYIEVGLELLTSSEDVSPSARALVDRLGGSMTTANKAMRVFWGYIGRRLAYDQQYPDGMPVEVIKAMENLMAIARGAAAEELESESARLKAYEEEIASRMATLESSVDSLSAELEGSRSEVQGLQSQLELTKQRLIEAEERASSLQEENSDLEDQITVLTEERQRANDEIGRLRDELGNLKSDYNDKSSLLIESQGQCNVLQERISHLKAKDDEHLSQITDSNKTIDALRDQLDTAMAESNDKSTSLAKLEVEASEQRRYISRLEAGIESLKSETSTLHENISRLEGSANELGVMTARNNELEKRIDDLVKERDRLLALVKPAQNDKSKSKKGSEDG
ncbi:MAG: DNA-binding protein [Candidatus Thiodiazotropha endolucinida]|nr:DNA-binding protein [Candidatus Thiodiazotropha endolucinida]